VHCDPTTKKVKNAASTPVIVAGGEPITRLAVPREVIVVP
jgi:hypothetical protein